MNVPIFRWLRQRFNLAADTAAAEDIREEVEAGLAFGGANLWVLVFAILVASVGLNVNSTAVVIGAMLISPLMGPIVGVGYGAATMELGLIRRSLTSLALAAGTSLLVSALYFRLTPLTDAGSELIARTEPTTWDVLIALFGGAAGAVGLTRRERGNVIPGVAIATALMPPLCTAGYGLATGNWPFMLGAMYLFCINSVFISVSTFLVVQVLPLPRHTFVSTRQARRVRLGVWGVALLTAVPSVYLAVRIVQRTTFEHNAEQFVDAQLNQPGTYVLTRRSDARTRTINVLLAGKLEPARLDSIRARLPDYKLGNAKLVVRQGIGEVDSADVRTFRNRLLEDASMRSNQALAGYDARLAQLQHLLAAADSAAVPPLPPAPALLHEVQVWSPTVRRLVLSRYVRPATDSLRADTAVVADVSLSHPLPEAEQRRLTEWLRQRTGGRWDVRLVLNGPPPKGKGR